MWSQRSSADISSSTMKKRLRRQSQTAAHKELFHFFSGGIASVDNIFFLSLAILVKKWKSINIASNFVHRKSTLSDPLWPKKWFFMNLFLLMFVCACTWLSLPLMRPFQWSILTFHLINKSLNNLWINLSLKPLQQWVV